MVDAYRGGAPLPSVTDDRVLVGRDAVAVDQRMQNDEAQRAAMAQTEAANRAAAEMSLKQRRDAAIEAERARLADPQAQGRYQEGEGMATFGTAIDALSGRTTVTGPRPGYAATKKYVDTVQPLVEEQAPNRQAVHDAELYREQVAAQALQDAADQQRSAMVDLRATQQAQALRENEQLKRMREAHDLTAKATDDFNKAAEIDPGRYWANAPVWQKFTAAIAAAMLGWVGRSDATAHITGAIREDVEAQKANLSRMQSGVEARRNAAAGEESYYGTLLAQTGSEREADLIYTNARLQQAATQMSATLQKAGVTVLNAGQQEAFNALQQQIADNTRNLEMIRSANTPTVSRSVRNVQDPDARRLIGKMGEQGLTEAAAGRAAVVDTAQKREDFGAKANLERTKAEREGGDKILRGEGGILSELTKFDSRVGAQQGVVALIEDMEKQYEGKDIPGIVPGALGEGAGGWDAAGRYVAPGASESAKVDSQIKAIKEALGRAQSQGAITPEELDNFSNYIESGLFLGGDSRFRQNLGEVKNMLNARIQSAERTLSPEARAYYHRNKDIGDLGARPGSGAVGTEDPVVQE